MEYLTVESLYPGGDSNGVHSEYESGTLSQSQHSHFLIYLLILDHLKLYFLSHKIKNCEVLR
jgi:hypothetical protein